MLLASGIPLDNLSALPTDGAEASLLLAV